MSENLVKIENALGRLDALRDKLANTKVVQKTLSDTVSKIRNQTQESNKISNDLYVYEYEKQISELNETTKKLNAEYKQTKLDAYNLIVDEIGATSATEEKEKYDKLINYLTKILGKKKISLVPVAIGARHVDEHIESYVDTNDKRKHNHIASIVKQGFADESGTEFIKPVVTVYKYNSAESAGRGEKWSNPLINAMRINTNKTVFKEFFSRSYLLIHLITLGFAVATMILLMIESVSINLPLKIATGTGFSKEAIIALLSIANLCVLHYVFTNVFNKKGNDVCDFLYPLFIFMYIVFAVRYAIRFSAFGLAVSLVMMLLCALAFYLRIVLHGYEPQELFTAKNRFTNYLFAFIKKYSYLQTVSVIAGVVICEYVLARLGYFELLFKNYAVLGILNALFILIAFLLIALFTFVNLKKHDITATDYALVMFDLASLSSVIVTATLSSPLAITIISAIFFAICTTGIVFRILYRKIYEV